MTDIDYMKKALIEAEKAMRKDEVPVGCVIIRNNKIIAKAHNLIREKKDPTAHAEILAIKKASKNLSNERLLNCAMYVSIEPCAMCAGAILLARIKKLVFGAKDTKTGACGSVFKIINDKKNNHKIELIKGVLKEESSKIMKNFFKAKRKKHIKPLPKY